MLARAFPFSEVCEIISSEDVKTTTCEFVLLGSKLTLEHRNEKMRDSRTHAENIRFAKGRRPFSVKGAVPCRSAAVPGSILGFGKLSSTAISANFGCPSHQVPNVRSNR